MSIRSSAIRRTHAVAVASSAILMLMLGLAISPHASAEPSITWSGSIAMSETHTEHLSACDPIGYRFQTSWQVVDETVPLSAIEEDGSRTSVVHLIPLDSGTFGFTDGSASCYESRDECMVDFAWSGIYPVDTIEEPIAVEMRTYANAGKLAIRPIYNSVAHDWTLRASLTQTVHEPCSPGTYTSDTPLTQGYGAPRYELSPEGFPERDDRVGIHSPTAGLIEVDGPHSVTGSPDMQRTPNFGGEPFGSWFFSEFLAGCQDVEGCGMGNVTETSTMTETLKAVIHDLEPICDDGLDNDGDGSVDFPADQGCQSASDESELSTNECDNGTDDDGDGNVDFPADFDCPSNGGAYERPLPREATPVPGKDEEKPGEEKPVDYSFAGVCGKKAGSHAPRCYVLLEAGTIRALKSHEATFAGLVSAGIPKAVGKAARQVAKNKIRNTIVNFGIKKLAGEGVATAYGGFSLGQLLGKITGAAIFARRWADLETPGYPHKCFQVQLTYDNSKPKIGLDPIHSFVRSWDFDDPPSYRPMSTSMARWEAPGDANATLPLFCKGVDAQAMTLGSSSGLTELLDPPYVRFSIDFNR